MSKFNPQLLLALAREASYEYFEATVFKQTYPTTHLAEPVVQSREVTNIFVGCNSKQFGTGGLVGGNDPIIVRAPFHWGLTAGHICVVQSPYSTDNFIVVNLLSRTTLETCIRHKSSPVLAVCRIDIWQYAELLTDELKATTEMDRQHDLAQKRKLLVSQLDNFPHGSQQREAVMNVLNIKDPEPVITGLVDSTDIFSIHPIASGTSTSPPAAPPPMAPPPMAPWVGQPHGNFEKDDKNPKDNF